MPLNFSIVERFISDYQGIMKDKGLLRHERYKILASLRDELQSSLQDYEAFERELASLIIDKIEKATTYEELLQCHMRAVAGIENYFMEEDTIMDIHDLFRIIRDSITVKVLKLVEEEMERDGFGSLPTDYVWIGLGSEGRDEQTFITDQDNMIIYEEKSSDSVTDALAKIYYEHAQSTGNEEGVKKPVPKKLFDFYYEVFSKKAVDRLHDVGFERCKGGVISSNERWRGSVEDWGKRIEDRLTFEQGVFESLDVIILTDARPIEGDRNILDRFLKKFFNALGDNKTVMKDFIQSAVLMPTALSFFGNFKTEKSGDHTDQLNIKLLGWAPLILAVRMIALSNSIYETNTLHRIRLLRKMNVIKKDMENDLIDAYLIFVRFRIMNQIRYKEDGGKDTNYLKPDLLGPEEQEKLRKAMKAVEALQKYMQEVLLFGQPI